MRRLKAKNRLGRPPTSVETEKCNGNGENPRRNGLFGVGVEVSGLGRLGGGGDKDRTCNPLGAGQLAPHLSTSFPILKRPSMLALGVFRKAAVWNGQHRKRSGSMFLLNRSKGGTDTQNPPANLRDVRSPLSYFYFLTVKSSASACWRKVLGKRSQKGCMNWANYRQLLIPSLFRNR
jgi:hypothetical protein